MFASKGYVNMHAGSGSFPCVGNVYWGRRLI